MQHDTIGKGGARFVRAHRDAAREVPAGAAVGGAEDEHAAAHVRILGGARAAVEDLALQERGSLAVEGNAGVAAGLPILTRVAARRGQRRAIDEAHRGGRAVPGLPAVEAVVGPAVAVTPRVVVGGGDHVVGVGRTDSDGRLVLSHGTSVQSDVGVVGARGVHPDVVPGVGFAAARRVGEDRPRTRRDHPANVRTCRAVRDVAAPTRLGAGMAEDAQGGQRLLRGGGEQTRLHGAQVETGRLRHAWAAASRGAAS